MKKSVHYLPEYLLNPNYALTCNIIGAGGTGSCLLTKMAMLNVTLIGLNHPGLQVRLWDDDIVMPNNIGRQMFYETDINRFKSEVLIERINATFGFNWIAYTHKLGTRISKSTFSNIWITCVDSWKSRQNIHKLLKEKGHRRSIGSEVPYYWIDIGNDHHYGQIVIGTVSKVSQPKSKEFKTVEKLKCLFEVFPQMRKAVDKVEDGPSCSLMNSLSEQDLFINSIAADLCADLLWKLFRTAKVPYNVLYFSLDPYAINVKRIGE